MEACTEKLAIKSSSGCAHGFDRFITRREKKSKHQHRQGFAISCGKGEVGAPGSFVTNLSPNLSPNLVMNLVNH